MDYVYMFILILLILITKNNALTCTCNCGPSIYYPSASCTTSTQCSQICYWGYSSCYKVNTQGCCGSLACTWYSGDEVYNEPGMCVCKCASGSSYGSTEQGRANSSTCSSSTCQSVCQILYPSSCGTYTNDAYCDSVGNHHRIDIPFIVFFLIITIYFTRK